MNLTLRAGEKLYLNGDVIRVDRKVTIELLNDVTFLMQSHVLQADEATTPLRQVYFAVQVILMDPAAASYAVGLASKLIESALLAYQTPQIVGGLKAISALIARALLRGVEGFARDLSAGAKGDVSGAWQGSVASRLKGTIMNVNPTTATSNAAAATSTSSAAAPVNALSPKDFITLLIAEMKNQDPTKPMDPTQMVSQLATVSQVGQAVKTNATLSSLLTATSLTQAEQLIGKKVTSADGSASGTVASVTVSSTDTMAMLTNGEQFSLANGVTISAQ